MKIISIHRFSGHAAGDFLTLNYVFVFFIFWHFYSCALFMNPVTWFMSFDTLMYIHLSSQQAETTIKKWGFKRGGKSFPLIFWWCHHCDQMIIIFSPSYQIGVDCNFIWKYHREGKDSQSVIRPSGLLADHSEQVIGDDRSTVNSAHLMMVTSCC